MVFGYSDIDGEGREWNLPRLGTTRSKSAFETLSLIKQANTPISMANLHEETEYAKSTITRHIKYLEFEGTGRVPDQQSRKARQNHAWRGVVSGLEITLVTRAFRRPL